MFPPNLRVRSRTMVRRRKQAPKEGGCGASFRCFGKSVNITEENRPLACNGTVAKIGQAAN